MLTNTSKPKRNNTPANMPAASGKGIRCIKRSNTPLKPTAATNKDDTTKAPITSAMGIPLAAVINIAAPGVDHAVTTGCL